MSDIPAARRKLAEPVAEALIEDIRSGRLKPGDLLPSERALMAAHEIGRPAVREALQRLQHAGLVEIRHGGRARVVSPSLSRTVDQLGETMRHLLVHSAASLENLKEARTMFEAGMARLAARKRSSRDLARLRAILAAQREARADRERFVALDGEFHREIASIAGNPLFAVVSEAVFLWLRDFYFGAVSVRGLEALTLEEHESILAALEAGDAEAASRRMSDHLERANELYRKSHLEDRT
ncbi:MAG: transcriptional regulator NanR [Pikeienuella sp.]|uniref:transcriptional regulator NanR n=1 Tax=Pikeienuella sp. TaxID=2831957 RepID=UPI00391CB35B